MFIASHTFFRQEIDSNKIKLLSITIYTTPVGDRVNIFKEFHIVNLSVMYIFIFVCYQLYSQALEVLNALENLVRQSLDSVLREMS